MKIIISFRIQNVQQQRQTRFIDFEADEKILLWLALKIFSSFFNTVMQKKKRFLGIIYIGE